ncbi:hypothetical protein BS50DRAFT_576024 [Corynespora cassiicola Philippines]|uniref:JmjC domain-containing histone demethylation protein 1 n=1 Tax=Corynespora cassiicola Philippines TaxID=1448308 RepID=A0A2T2NGL5_CORCC|nr:hypothetical protein BS50DRAFT_576024 [Corynespora cassiicola Philippines]
MARPEPARPQLQLAPPAATYEQPPPLRSAPLPRRNPQYSPALGSPIEALASAAVSSIQASPGYFDPPRRPSHAPLSPATALPLPHTERVPKHAPQPDPAFSYNDRPTKRARTDVPSSPHYGQRYSRPATSHIPGWSYNVEQMADNGVRMYQDHRVPAPYQEDSSSKRLSDAQLLLDFHHSISASPSAPPPAAMAKRWSVSHSDRPDPYAVQSFDVNSPYSRPSHARYVGPHYAHPSNDALDFNYRPEPSMKLLTDRHPNASAVQTHTPPEEGLSATLAAAAEEANGVEPAKPKKHQGWPKGKPRGPRAGASGSKRKRTTPKPKNTSAGAASGAPDQLHSPQSLPAEQHDPSRTDDANPLPTQTLPLREHASQNRRHSFSNTAPDLQNADASATMPRAQSVPLGANIAMTPPAEQIPQPSNDRNAAAGQITVCAGCHSSDSHTVLGDGEQWISCDGCKEWYHFVCAGFKSEREVRDVDKFYCPPCRPKFGDTTKVRKSGRAHTAVDYAGLNEGILKTSDDNPEHHYIAAFKNGDIEFAPENFARLPPELITADFLEKTNGFKEPILIPATLNPRPRCPGRTFPDPDPTQPQRGDPSEEAFGYELVPDDGQDKMDMVIPEGLTVRRVAELYGPQELVPVIDVKAQEGEDRRWTMAKWADYYEQEGEKPVRNVISLEVSRSRLGRLIRRPKAVRDMDLQDSVWPEDDKTPPPPVQFYCLMSVADCYTDFHIDFGGSSVYYHIVKGKKVFFFIPPTKQNLKKYEDWCLSPRQGHEFLGHQVKDCYRVDLYPGDTMLIPSGWIHAVWTPEDSLVIGGNFLTRIHYGMQIKVLEIEKNTKVATKFRYPYFQKIMWLAVLRYLEDDPVPPAVEQLFLSGGQFARDVPIYCEPDKFGHNSHLGPQNYNSRYYSKAELDALPDLANYIWRTVMISLGRIEGITQTVRNAVTKSIPKGHGEPLALARRFAMWIAWKRGNENLPQWAHPDASLPETADASGEKKMSAAQVKRMEREAWSEAVRATAERQSTRIKGTDSLPPNGSPTNTQSTPPQPLTGFLRPATDSRHMTTPKTSQLGPKRIACDACRKRRIRCKHKDEIVETSKAANGINGMGTIDLSGSYGISVKRRQNESSVPSFGTNMNSSDGAAVVNGGPLLADVNSDPYALKSGRVKACADCRKSKRRCIHDEFGNVDPVKANEVPIPRGSASKKRRISDVEPETTGRKVKKEYIGDATVMNGDAHLQHAFSTPSRKSGSGELQGIAYAAQMAIGRAPPETPTNIDPALQSYEHIHGQPPHRDAVISSIENPSNGSPMQGVEQTPRSEPHGPSVEPLTPGPVPMNIQNEPSSIMMDPSSPLSLPAQSVSPTGIHVPGPAPPITPIAPRSSTGPKTSQTPRPLNRKSNTPKTPGGKKDTIKTEPRTESKARALSSTTGEKEEDMASLALALKLQMEEHGLRRRSK